MCISEKNGRCYSLSEKEFAEVADLLAPAEGTKEITIEDKKVKIKKINIGELADILKVTKDNELEQYIYLVFRGVVEPHLKVDEIRKMRHTTLFKLALEIQKFSELDKESMNKLESFLTGKS